MWQKLKRRNNKQCEQPHDKTNKMTWLPEKPQIIRPGWSESSLSAWRNTGPLTKFFPWFSTCTNVYSPRAGTDNPLGMKFWCQQDHTVTPVICCKFWKNLFEVWFYTIFFMILYMYIPVAPGQGQTDPRGQSFDVNRIVLSLHSFVASLKKMSLKSDFIHFYDCTCI